MQSTQNSFTKQGIGCKECGAIPIECKGLCKKHYIASRRKRGECPGCHKPDLLLVEQGHCSSCCRKRRDNERQQRVEQGLPARKQRKTLPTQQVLNLVRIRGQEFQPILDTTRQLARYNFRHLERERREELVAECVAAAWCEITRMLTIGKEPLDCPFPVAAFAVRRVKRGKTFDNTKSMDVLDYRNQQMLGRTREEFREYQHNIVHQPTTLFCDLLEWLAHLSETEADLLLLFLQGYEVNEVALELGMQPQLVEQTRSRLYGAWLDHCSR